MIVNIPFPVICNNAECETVWFAPHIMNAGPNTTVQMIDAGVEPCPECGGKGKIPNGAYTIAGAELFSQTDLNKIISALNVLQEQAEAGTTAEDIKEEISRKYPFLEYLKPFIPKTPADVVAYLVVLSMLLNHCARQPDASQQPQVHIQVEVQQVLEQMNADQKTSQPNSQQQQSKPKVP